MSDLSGPVGDTAEWADYEVEMTGDVREVYVVRAKSAQDARDRWSQGRLILSEASGMEFYESRLADG